MRSALSWVGSRRSGAVVVGSFLVAVAPGCATGSGSGDASPFPGEEALKGRLKEMNDKFDVVAKACASKKEDEAGGVFEIVADGKGGMTGRALIWKGTPETQACMLDAIKKNPLGPFAGPPVATRWDIGPQQPEPKDPGDGFKSDLQATQLRLQDEINACAQRYLPNEFDADVAISFQILPGGKSAVVNVVSSTAKDGGYENCVRESVAGATFPDPKMEYPFQTRLSFHVGKINKL